MDAHAFLPIIQKVTTPLIIQAAFATAGGNKYG